MTAAGTGLGAADASGAGARPEPVCIFCEALALDTQAPLVVHRGARAYVILNLYPSLATVT